MKRIVFLTVTLLAVFAFNASAETDEEMIRKAALDYVEGWYTGDAERMERCLHLDLAKRIVRHDAEQSRDKLDHLSAMTLVQYTRAGYGKKIPKEMQQKDVYILDIYDGKVASVKAVMSGWIDYLHVAKVDGDWKIVNVLWELKPENRYSGQ